MNVRILGRGDDSIPAGDTAADADPSPNGTRDGHAAAADPWPTAHADTGAPDGGPGDGPIAEPVSIGDRLRHLLSSGGEKTPLYPRILRLRHVHPNGWQRAFLVEGMGLIGTLAALADRATAWAPLVLPAGAAVVVKFHDVLAGVLPRRPAPGNETAAPPERGNAAETDE